jgi:hypothetical protein
VRTTMQFIKDAHKRARGDILTPNCSEWSGWPRCNQTAPVKSEFGGALCGLIPRAPMYEVWRLRNADEAGMSSQDLNLRNNLAIKSFHQWINQS